MRYLALLIVFCACSHPLQITRDSVNSETQSAHSYLLGRSIGEEFRGSFYDSAQVFVATDTAETQYFGGSLNDFRHRDSVGRVSQKMYHDMNDMLTHALNIISLTAK